MKLKVKVVPGSSKDAIGDWLGDELKIKVQAPPEKGRANKAVEKLLAKTLGLSREHVAVVSGQASPKKIIEIKGLPDPEVWALLPPRE